jgi:inner membrane protein
MPSIITHAAIPLILGAAAGLRCISGRLLLTGAIVAALPDIDVISFKLGFAYSDVWGHRGAVHSIAFALAITCLVSLFYRSLHTSRWRCIAFVLLSALSHPLLDACTNGGLGVALLWPLNENRWFMPFRPIEVSPIGVTRFFSARGWAVMQSEILWVWLPAMGLAIVIIACRCLCPSKLPTEWPIE